MSPDQQFYNKFNIDMDGCLCITRTQSDTTLCTTIYDTTMTGVSCIVVHKVVPLCVQLYMIQQ